MGLLDRHLRSGGNDENGDSRTMTNGDSLTIDHSGINGNRGANDDTNGDDKLYHW